MSVLLGKYKTYLRKRDVDDSSYTSQHLKTKLQAHPIGKGIVFHVPYDRSTSELVYSNSISLQDVINTAFHNASTTTQPTRTAPPVQQMDKYTLIYHAAKAINADIGDITGIPTQPINISDMTLTQCKSKVPDSLYKLFQYMLTGGDAEPSDDLERKIVMMTQDAIHVASHDRVKTPKHTCLGLTVRHLIGSKQLLTILNRMGHCSSYDEVEIVDTSLAMETIAKADLYGLVLPSNISPGVFVQAVADNNDLNGETLDGKNTTHANTLVLFQKGTFGPTQRRQTLADHSVKRKSLISFSAIDILSFGAGGRRPLTTSFHGKTGELFGCISDLENIFAAGSVDMAWAISRMLPTKFFEVELDRNRPGQSIPGWGQRDPMAEARRVFRHRDSSGWIPCCTQLSLLARVPAEGGESEVLLIVADKVSVCRDAFDASADVSEAIGSLQNSISPLLKEFDNFKFIKAEKSGKWPLHLSATACMTPCFNAMDRSNYARWLPVYLADMKQLSSQELSAAVCCVSTELHTTATATGYREALHLNRQQSVITLLLRHTKQLSKFSTTRSNSVTPAAAVPKPDTPAIPMQDTPEIAKPNTPAIPKPDTSAIPKPNTPAIPTPLRSRSPTCAPPQSSPSSRSPTKSELKARILQNERKVRELKRLLQNLQAVQTRSRKLVRPRPGRIPERRVPNNSAPAVLPLHPVPGAGLPGERANELRRYVAPDDNFFLRNLKQKLPREAEILVNNAIKEIVSKPANMAGWSDGMVPVSHPFKSRLAEVICIHLFIRYSHSHKTMITTASDDLDELNSSDNGSDDCSLAHSQTPTVLAGNIPGNKLFSGDLMKFAMRGMLPTAQRDTLFKLCDTLKDLGAPV
uniref:Uncharacterized protein n=1 Tax=Branchiostoma floridae TaxID=7739 RepID=C3Z158_BRAFL|eukprot:XP_002597745.1 hypothetical protein BRAFLDRAFT_77352 [Branchiostoma floridae]